MSVNPGSPTGPFPTNQVIDTALLPGVPGQRGAQGVQGTQGLQGFQGIQGFGYAQLQGVQGVEGPRGFQGLQGTQGLQGIQGIQGVQGTQGIQGVQATVAVGTTTTGAAGTSAAVTNTGTASAGVFNFTVPQGIQGTQGIQGLQGVQGPQGTQGIQGFQGFQGPQGTQGIQGFQGTQGIQGTQRIQGLQGLQGFTGVVSSSTDPGSSYYNALWLDTGSAAAVPASIPNTVITAKGDLILGSAASTAGNLAVGSDGKVLVADSTNALGASWQKITANSLDTTITSDLTSMTYLKSKLGESTGSSTATIDVIPRFDVTGTSTPTTGVMYLSMFTPMANTTISRIAYAVGATALSVNTGTVQFALYQYNESDQSASLKFSTLNSVTDGYKLGIDGSWTAVTATSDTNKWMFGATNGVYSKLIDPTTNGGNSTFTLTAGTRYAVAVLIVSGGTLPALSSTSAVSGGLIFHSQPRLAAFSTQASLPSSVTNASWTTPTTAFVLWARVYAS
jgi:hypothetical protein